MIVCIESPFAGNVEFNVEYAKLAMKDSLSRGEAPFLSHLLYTQVLDDTKPDERGWGISASFPLPINSLSENNLACAFLYSYSSTCSIS